MKVIVTGSSGFIGRHLIQLLAANGYKVVALDVTPPIDTTQSVSFYQCNILDRESLAQIVSSAAPQAVVHLAARTDLMGQSVDEYPANIAGINNLISAVLNTPSVERCIVTSSQLVCRVGYVPLHMEDFQPDTPYGQSKVMTEKIVRERDWGATQWCLVRPTTVWGPGMNPHYQTFFRLIQQGRYFHVGTRPLYKTYGYVGNVAWEYLQLLKAPGAQVDRQVFYVADYEPLSLRGWADALQRELNAKPIPTVPEPLARMLARTGDMINRIGVSRFPFNSFRLKNILTEYQFDLSPTKIVCRDLPFTLEQGVKETVSWIRTL